MSEKKNVWEMKPDEIALIDGKKYKWKRDLRKRMPTLGVCSIREIVNIDDPKDKHKFLRGIIVEVLDESGK